MSGPEHRRAALLGVALTLAGTTGTVALAGATARAWPGTGVVDVDAALATVALAGAAAVAAWLSVVLALATAEMVRARPHGPHQGPARARALPRPVRLTCAVLVAVSGSTAWPALATPSAVVPTHTVSTVETAPRPADRPDGAGTAPSGLASPPVRPDDGGRAVPQPGWTPTAPSPRPTAPDGVALVSTVPHERLPGEVVVRRGDTLWDIAARHLGPGTSAAEIAEEWPRWYAANADVIGSDPDLIHPGMQLVAPGRAGSTSTEGTDR